MNDAVPAPGPPPAAFDIALDLGDTPTGLGIGQDGGYTRTGRVCAFLAGLWTMVLFFPLLVVGALLYARAEEVFADRPDRARTLVTWSWISLTVAPVVCAAATAGVLLLLHGGLPPR